MTLISAIIQQGFRESNLIRTGVSPTTNETTEALNLLQSIISSVVGNEAGEKLETFPVGTNGINASWTVPTIPNYLATNIRLICNLSGGQTLYLHPQPQDGARIGVVDNKGNFNTANLILNGNGRKIEAAASITLSTASLTREWFYRADTGNWAKLTTLLTSDQMPFPVEFDDLFIILLGMRLNPRNGVSLSQESATMLDRVREQFRARYSQTVVPPPDLGVLPTNSRWGGGNINNGWVW